MEQKQLDEIDESYLGEEFLDEDLMEEEVKVEKVRASPKKVKKPVKKAKAVKSTSKKVEDNVVSKKVPETVHVMNEDPIFEKKEEIVEPVIQVTPKEPKQEEPSSPSPSTPVDPWNEDDSDSGTGLFKEISTWKTLAGILVILLVVSVFTQGFHLSEGNTVTGDATLSLSEAEQKALTYVNTNLLQPPFTAEVEGSKELNQLYLVTLSVAGQAVDSYVTKDGTLFFPQGFDLTGDVIVDVNDEPQNLGSPVDVRVDDDAVKGSADAPVTIIEFSDYECPFCGKYVQETYPQIVTEYIDTGKVQYVFRDFPLDFHQNAQKASEAAECAGEQGKYWDMHDQLFANQNLLDVDNLKRYALNLGLDTDEFDTCLDSGSMEAEVQKDMADGQKAGVSGTPAFFINGKMISGAQPFSAFKTEIEAALSASGVEPTPLPVELEDPVDEEPVEVIEEPEPVVEEPEPEPAPVGQDVSMALSAKRWLFSPEQITVQEGDRVKLRISPVNLDFTFAIPGLDVAEDVSGTTTIEFTASKAGSYEFLCGSCEDWRGMVGTLVVK
ncbi:thioredoxin domain-containing protein [Candidatus Woesearchaeota archaeon]|jgi:protein-disulfide isomerase/plastocyanin|nr:thioredoxin domain-containing protein [Candidatus Woesearchaeota archaeon]MBT5396760.1 thioredoxin domain-containing protein [Candidatus Woesearchaeota archaeon]MBT5924720.1 thioredoxin domain-containing protein [Candidatus Woesearchaeota archaeon]MBT6367648.1 thioredoxin domain-containing protein [Candidatus Woesearchaeota archaeon]MBT7762951.1 thioredoxin domain-containing protein [Candidatus Woesearchaeota archaeon]